MTNKLIDNIHVCKELEELRKSGLNGGYASYRDWRISKFQGWQYLLWGKENNIRITYCPFCGKKLDE